MKWRSRDVSIGGWKDPHELDKLRRRRYNAKPPAGYVPDRAANHFLLETAGEKPDDEGTIPPPSANVDEEEEEEEEEEEDSTTSSSSSAASSASSCKENIAAKDVASPNFNLPEGWTSCVVTRKTGKTAGTKDRYYIGPDGRRFRSRKKVVQFLRSGNPASPKRRRLNTDKPGPS